MSFWFERVFDYYTFAWDSDFTKDSKAQYKSGKKQPLENKFLQERNTDLRSMLRSHLVMFHGQYRFDFHDGQKDVGIKNAAFLKKGIWILKYRVDGSKDFDINTNNGNSVEISLWNKTILPDSEEKWSFNKIFKELGIEVKVMDPKEMARKKAMIASVISQANVILKTKEWQKWQRMFVPVDKAQYGSREYKQHQQEFVVSSRDSTEVLYFDMESLILTDSSVVENYYNDWQQKSFEFCELLTRKCKLTDFVVVELSQSEYTGTIGLIDKEKADPYMPTNGRSMRALLGKRSVESSTGDMISAVSLIY